jgi:hypothetical protein
VTRTKRARTVGVAMTLALLAGCGAGSDGDGAVTTTTTPTGKLTAPTFDADPSATSSTTTTTTAGAGATTPPTGGATVEKVAFDDPVGDATAGVGLGAPSPWTDLAGGSLERQGNAFRLIVRLGGAPPARSDGRTTMNIASYFDVDGDGAVDFEIWANLGPNGWAPVWYDDEGHAAAGDRSNVTIKVTGTEVRLLFPDVMIDAPARLRFSLASEYGSLAALGTDAARRDDAPDGDRAVAFP